MTERKKRALEMAHNICKHRCTMCGENDSRPLICELFDNCLLLVGIGYRKEKEVEKETAKKIFTGLYKEIGALLFQKSKTTRSREELGACKQLSEIKEMLLENARVFGVEVKE